MKQTLLIVATLVLLASAGTCRRTVAVAEQPGDAFARLAGSRWRPVALYGQAVDGTTDAFLALDTATRRVAGNSGCNTFGGAYSRTAAGGALQFSQMISTRKMCLGRNIEAQFTAALAATTRYALRGDTLVFLDGDGAELCLFTGEAND
ncbi:MAG: META domain-containing protein [Tannerella sp.]|jgi:heat shock protein HslJ|nr:META domain-containing protein [Tannerella sp.]